MVSKEDWAAAMDSEIFREYLRNETPKLAVEKENEIKKQAAKVENQVDAELEVYAELDSFEKKIKESPELLNKFREVKAKLMENPEIMKQADPAFVEGILMLDLEDDNDS